MFLKQSNKTVPQGGEQIDEETLVGAFGHSNSVLELGKAADDVLEGDLRLVGLASDKGGENGNGGESRELQGV